MTDNNGNLTQAEPAGDCKPGALATVQDKPEGLTDVQIKAAGLIQQGIKPMTAIAVECGVSRTALYDWKEKPECQKYMASLEVESMDAAGQVLRAHVRHAALALLQGLKGKGQERLAAAKEILNRVLGDPSRPSGSSV